MSKGDELDILNHPHIRLTQIMRQALDSEIIRLSMWVREGNTLQSYQGDNEEVMILSQREVVTGMYDWADQIICATNAKRQYINDEVRKLKGFPKNELVVGDKVIGLSNHWEWLSSQGNALTNGCIGYVNDFFMDTLTYPKFITKKSVQVANIDFVTDDARDNFNCVPIDYQYLLTNKYALDSTEEFKIAGYNRNHADSDIYYTIPFQFTYGYAITCHKS